MKYYNKLKTYIIQNFKEGNMIKCNTVKCKYNKNGCCTKEWNIKDNDKGKESLFDKIKNIFKQE